jgi:signal transduction histidine kinase
VRAPQHNPFAIFVLPPDAVLHDGMQYDVSSDTAIVLRVLVLALGIASTGIAVGVGYLVRRTRRMRTVETFAAHQTERSEALTEQLARQSEREMLARELHDTLAHRLSVISLHSGALMVSAGDPERTVETASALQREAKASLEEVRSIVRDVRGEDRSSVGAAGTAVAPALASLRTVPDLVASVRATGAPVSATLLLEDLETAPAVLQKAAYRIIQESLTNAVKHAPGADVTVDVRASAAEGVHVVVSNRLGDRVQAGDRGAADGASADGPDAYLAGSGGGMGLIGLRERARLVGGDADAGPREGRFVVEVTLPPWGVSAHE